MRIVFLDRPTLPVPLPKPDFEHVWRDYDRTDADQLVAHAADAEILISNKVPIRAQHIAALPALRFIAACATGVNNIDLDACRAHGIVVSNLRNYGANTVAEHAFGLMLALSRNLLSFTGAVRSGTWQQSDMFCLFAAPVNDLAGKTLAVFGQGNIGRRLAAFARAFDMEVLAVERKGATVVRPGYAAFTQALERADILSLHLPLDEQSRHLLSHAEFACLKPSALLINTARGGLIDERALVDALQQGRLAGAGLDTLSEEPPKSNPLLDFDHPNLIITPHIAWASQHAMHTAARMLIDNLEAYVQGRPKNVVI